MADYNLMAGRSNRSAGIKDNLSALVPDYGTSRNSVSPARQSNEAFGKFSGLEGWW